MAYCFVLVLLIDVLISGGYFYPGKCVLAHDILPDGTRSSPVSVFLLWMQGIMALPTLEAFSAQKF